MVYLRITPLGLRGGNQDTTTLFGEEGTALIPAGGPGTIKINKHKKTPHSNISMEGMLICVCASVCVFVSVQAHAGCWMPIKVSWLVCRLVVLSRAKPLWEDLEELPLVWTAATYVHSDTGQQF